MLCCLATFKFWSNITGSLACKTNHFVQSKSQATKALVDRMKTGKLDMLISNLQLIFKVFFKKTMDAFLSIIPSRTCPKDFIHIKHCISRNK